MTLRNVVGPTLGLVLGLVLLASPAAAFYVPEDPQTHTFAESEVSQTWTWTQAESGDSILRACKHFPSMNICLSEFIKVANVNTFPLQKLEAGTWTDTDAHLKKGYWYWVPGTPESVRRYSTSYIRVTAVDWQEVTDFMRQQEVEAKQLEERLATNETHVDEMQTALAGFKAQRTEEVNNLIAAALKQFVAPGGPLEERLKAGNADLKTTFETALAELRASLRAELTGVTANGGVIDERINAVLEQFAAPGGQLEERIKAGNADLTADVAGLQRSINTLRGNFEQLTGDDGRLAQAEANAAEAKSDAADAKAAVPPLPWPIWSVGFLAFVCFILAWLLRPNKKLTKRVDDLKVDDLKKQVDHHETGLKGLQQQIYHHEEYLTGLQQQVNNPETDPNVFNSGNPKTKTVH